MADGIAQLPSYTAEKNVSDDDSLDKVAQNDVDVVDEKRLKEVEEFEERLALDEASEEEYLVQDAHDVAIKACLLPNSFLSFFQRSHLVEGLINQGQPRTPSDNVPDNLSRVGILSFWSPQTLSVSTLFLLVLSYWFGNGLHHIMPTTGIFKWLNPGPFNIKEHVAIIIMSSTAANSATAIQVISVQDLYYNNKMNAGIAIFTLIGSQLLGYGYAGLLQDVLVKPTKCFWPANISTANLFQALHYDNQMTSKRVRMFWLIFTFMFCWEIIPQWIFPLLTGVSIFCLANNHSPVFRNIFGGASNNEGMGLLSWSFDWNLIGSACLYNPIWLQINQDIGIIFTYILMSAVYYGNLWNAKSFPFMSQAIFPAWFSATNALYLITSNLSLGAVVTHVALYHWNDLKPFVKSLNPWNKDPWVVHDEHYEKMKAYKPIPRWWYLGVLVAAYAIAQANRKSYFPPSANYAGNSGLPWWALTVLAIISFIFCALYGTLAATIGFYEFNSSGTGFFQMITAYIVPGRPVANMYGALYGQHPMIQGIALLQDLKLGQYVKLAPRVTFSMQMIGTVVGAILNYVMMLSIITNNRDALLSVSGTRLWSGQNAQGYNSNAISWGALAPQMFGPGSTYKMVPISLAIGVILPFPFYFAHRMWPKVGFNNLNTSIIMQYSCFLSVGINTSVNPAMVIGIFSQWFVRTRFPRWFTKYNYIVAAALDGGTQVISFILNFAVFGASGTAHAFPTWWGNDINLSADRCLAPEN
ncbi:hypothetical protein NLI96_g2467 [Meripilus lineatus]|uniref:OPT oligopeptide transporter n=1 Tax=Meripilus lineatus TaxID=2056292 RepID=A0AAD5V8L7_9APHY|nr:hypothetical protein NLI96_g2467 [Physisporinus lineatus]